MSEFNLKVEILPPEMSGLPAYWQITGSPEEIKRILKAIEEEKI